MQQQTTLQEPTPLQQASRSQEPAAVDTAGASSSGLLCTGLPQQTSPQQFPATPASHPMPPILRRKLEVETHGAFSSSSNTPFRRRRTDQPGCSLQRGLTLIELMFTIAVIAVLCAVSAPSLGNIAASSRARSGNNTLITSLNLARNTSIAHQHEIVLCPSSAGTACEETTWWQHGWIAFADLDRDGQRSANEPILTRAGTQPGIAIATGSAREHVTYRPNGSASGTNLTFTFCDRRGPKYASTIVVSNPGRPRTGQATPAQAAAACAGLQ